MAHLIKLSAELLHCIFIELEIADLASLAATCRAIRAFVVDNVLLHKELYLRWYDDPTIEYIEPDWVSRFHDIVRLEKIFRSDSREAKRNELGFVAEQVSYLVDTAQKDAVKSKNIHFLEESFESSDNRDVFLCASSLWRTGGTHAQQAAPTPELRQASAKLHCLYGKAIEVVKSTTFTPAGFARLFAGTELMDLADLAAPPSAGTRSKNIPAHAVARSKVYDLRQYTEASLWGPFMDDGSQDIDWEKVEAVMIVLAFNIRKFGYQSGGRFDAIWQEKFAGATPGSYKSPQAIHRASEQTVQPQPGPTLEEQDPYGVTGTWLRIVTFLDYNHLYAFNFSSEIPPTQPRQPIDIEEGTIDLEEKLRVTAIEPPGSGDEGEDGDDGLDWSLFKGKRMPVVHFRGVSRSLHSSFDPNANSRIRGTVRQTPQGAIRWTTFSIFHGEERWRSEGIQVGGLRSARGVLGNWFDKDYHEHGPAGPTSFWKITDELATASDGSIQPAF